MILSRQNADLLRLISMGAVCLIHSTATFEWRFLTHHHFLSEDFAAVLVNQVGRYCVFLFVFLSGYGLASREFGRPPEKRLAALPFYFDRLKRIGLPYVFFSLILLCFIALPHGGFREYLRVLPGTLLNGSADYHFYFFPLILSCYLFFPLLLRLENPVFIFITLASLLFFTSPAHVILGHFGIHRPEFPTWMPFQWLFYFHFGTVLARIDVRHKSADPGLEKKNSAPGWRFFSVFVLVSALVLLLAEYLFWSYRQDRTDYFNHNSRWVVLLYALAWVFFSRAWNGPLTGWLEKPFFAKSIPYLAGVSFTVFILHTKVLGGLAMTRIGSSFFLLAPMVLGLTLLVVWLLDLGIRWNFLRLCFGLPEKK